MAEESEIKKLEKKYEKIRKKYSLPSFKDMNEDFDIEKLQEKETTLLIREIRRAVMEKNNGYLRFCEMFMNPSHAPLFFLGLAKNFDGNEKNLVKQVYLKLGKFEIKSIELDNKYEEKKEAEFIRNFCKEWEEIKDNFGKIINSLEDSWERKVEERSRRYLG